MFSLISKKRNLFICLLFIWICLGSEFSWSMNIHNLNIEDTDCTPDKIDSLADRFRCEQSMTYDSCKAHMGVTLASTFLLAPNIQANENFQTSFIKLKSVAGSSKRHNSNQGLSPYRASEVQQIAREMEKKRIRLDSDIREFSRVFNEAVSKIPRKPDGSIRIRAGGPTTVRNLFLMVKDEIQNKIPNNQFTQNFLKGATKPSQFLKRDFENIVIQMFPEKDQKRNRPSIEGFISLQESRYDYKFFQRFQKSNPKINLRMDQGGIPNEMADSLSEYRKFRSFILHSEKDEVQYHAVKKIPRKREPVVCQGTDRGKLVGGGIASALGEWAIGATQDLNAAETIGKCLKDLNINLDHEEALELIANVNIKKSQSSDKSCGDLEFDPEDIQLLTAKNKSELRQFFCSLNDKLNKSDQTFEKLVKDGVNWNCDGDIELPGSSSYFNNGQLSLVLRSGRKATINLNSANEWVYENINTDDNQLKAYLIDKIRFPIVSQKAKKYQLDYRFACNNRYNFSEDLCDIASHMELVKHVKYHCQFLQPK